MSESDLPPDNVHPRKLAFERLDELFRTGWSIGEVVSFHTREKLLILAHDEATYRKLGPLVAGAKSVDREEFRAQYSELFRHALNQPPTFGSHTNVLQHLAGFFRNMPGHERAMVHQAIEEYRAGSRSVDSARAAIASAAMRCDLKLVAESTYLCES